jgi:Cu+-exporting ATPase
MKKFKVGISGMHCASCASNIERSLRKVPGVKEVSISLMLKKGTVEAEDSVSEEAIQQAVKKTGYTATSVEKA